MIIHFCKRHIYYILSSLFLSISLFLYFSPLSRNFFETFSKSKESYVLSKIITSKVKKSTELGIFKIKKHGQIWLEIYKNPLTELELIESFKLDGVFDAHIVLKDQSSNLIIANIDEDKEYEILAPTYNKKMKPILNIFKYDSLLKDFKRINTQNSKLFL